MDAFKMAQEWNPKVILIDIVMPVMAGIEAIKKIKSTDWGMNILINLKLEFLVVISNS